MAITKDKKKEIIAGLEKAISKSKSVVFVQFHKLLVKDASVIRRSLKSENVGYVVAKKSLFKKVLGNASIKGEAPALTGELALAYLSAEASAKADAAPFRTDTAQPVQQWERMGPGGSCRASNPVRGPDKVPGGFDSHTLPPILTKSRNRNPNRTRNRCCL